MKLLTLLGALVVTASPVHALAQESTPGYARAIAFEICRNMRDGMSATTAGTKAIETMFPVYGNDMKRDGFSRAAHLIVAERIILCSELK